MQKPREADVSRLLGRMTRMAEDSALERLKTVLVWQTAKVIAIRKGVQAQHETRRPILEWIEKMTVGERAQLLSVVDQNWVKRVLRMHANLQERGPGFFVQLDSGERDRRGRRASHPAKSPLLGAAGDDDGFLYRSWDDLAGGLPDPEHVHVNEEWFDASAQLQQYVRVCDSSNGLDTLTLAESLMRDMSRLIELFDGVSFGQFLGTPCSRTAALEPSGETGWLHQMGVCTLSAFIVSKLELAIWRAWGDASTVIRSESAAGGIPDLPGVMGRKEYGRRSILQRGLRSKQHLVEFWTNLPPQERKKIIGRPRIGEMEPLGDDSKDAASSSSILSGADSDYVLGADASMDADTSSAYSDTHLSDDLPESQSLSSWGRPGIGGVVRSVSSHMDDDHSTGLPGIEDTSQWPVCMVTWDGARVVEHIYSFPLSRAGTAEYAVAREIGHRLQTRWADSVAMNLMMAHGAEGLPPTGKAKKKRRKKPQRAPGQVGSSSASVGAPTPNDDRTDSPPPVTCHSDDDSNRVAPLWSATTHHREAAAKAVEALDSVDDEDAAPDAAWQLPKHRRSSRKPVKVVRGAAQEVTSSGPGRSRAVTTHSRGGVRSLSPPAVVRVSPDTARALAEAVPLPTGPAVSMPFPVEAASADILFGDFGQDSNPEPSPPTPAVRVQGQVAVRAPMLTAAVMPVAGVPPAPPHAVMPLPVPLALVPPAAVQPVALAAPAGLTLPVPVPVPVPVQVPGSFAMPPTPLSASSRASSGGSYHRASPEPVAAPMGMLPVMPPSVGGMPEFIPVVMQDGIPTPYGMPPHMPGGTASYEHALPVDGSRLAELHREVFGFAQACTVAASARRSLQFTAVSRIAHIVTSVIPNATVDLFGSFVSGLAIPTSDVDILVYAPFNDALVRALGDAVGKESWVSSVHAVVSTAVPVIKVTANSPPGSDVPFPIRLDVTFFTMSHKGTSTTRMAISLASWLPPLAPLLVFLKQLLAEAGFSDPFSGGMSSYALLLITAGFLRMRLSRWPMVVVAPAPAAADGMCSIHELLSLAHACADGSSANRPRSHSMMDSTPRGVGGRRSMSVGSESEPASPGRKFVGGVPASAMSSAAAGAAAAAAAVAAASSTTDGMPPSSSSSSSTDTVVAAAGPDVGGSAAAGGGAGVGVPPMVPPSPLLGQLLLELLHFIGYRYRASEQGLTADGMLFSTAGTMYAPSELVLPDPQDVTINVGRTCFRFSEVQRMFAATYDALVSEEPARRDGLLLAGLIKSLPSSYFRC